MSVRLFLETTWHPAFRYGGWGYARDIAGTVAGAAGGDRNMSAQGLEFKALSVSLASFPFGPVALVSASPGLLAAARLLAAAEEPEEDKSLYRVASKALAGRPLGISAAAKAAPASVFLAAWAEVGQGKGKIGRFTAAIPKPNLAKLVLP
jgi:hypothetical protein